MSGEAGQFSTNKLVQDEITEVVLWHTVVEEWKEALMDNESHENAESQLFVLQIRQEAGSKVVHTLAISNLGQDVSYSLQDVKKLFSLFLGEHDFCDRVLCPLEIH